MQPFLSGLAFTIAFMCVLPLTANAEINSSQFEDQYLRDKDFAIHQVNPALEQQCLQDISKKIGSQTVVSKTAKLSFNDNITREVYKQFYWNKSDRGVAFILPVKAHDKRIGDVSTDIACFYAMTGNGLEFQLSQQILWRL